MLTTCLAYLIEFFLFLYPPPSPDRIERNCRAWGYNDPLDFVFCAEDASRFHETMLPLNFLAFCFMVVGMPLLAAALWWFNIEQWYFALLAAIFSILAPLAQSALGMR